MFSRQAVMLLDMIVSSVMGLSLIINSNLHTQLFGAMLIAFSYAMHQTLDVNHIKGNQIALNTKSIFWFMHTMLSFFNDDFQNLMITIPMFALTSYHIFFESHGCSNNCSHSKRARSIRKRINALKRRAREHPTVHDGYKTD